MIIYSLLLKNGSSFSLNGAGVTTALKNAVSLGEVSATKESSLLPRSYGDGSAKVGDSRLTMTTLTLNIAVTFTTDEEGRAFINALYSALNNAEYLVNETNQVRARIDLSSPVLAWDEGCFLRVGTATIALNQLDPYWESVSPVQESFYVEAGVPALVQIENEGFGEAPFLLRVTVEDQPTAVSLVEAQNLEEGRALAVESDSFGIDGFTELAIDATEGTATLINTSANASMDAQEAFVAGSGYFNLLVGTNELSLRCSVAALFVFEYRTRSFI